MTDLRALLAPIRERLTAQLPDNARMDAYYYGFNRTNFGPVDAILSAVAVAGKGSHHTESWADTDSGWFYGDRPGLPSADGAADLIQKTADIAARNITADQTRLLAAIEAVERTAANLDRLADGDRHYANLFRQALAAALGSDTTNQEGTQ